MTVYLKLLTLLVFTVLFSCNKENPLSTEEKKMRGTISGTITDSESNPISGVDISTDQYGYNGVTNTQGVYIIPDVTAGAYELTFTHVYYIDTVLTGVQISKAEQVVAVDLEMREILGAFHGKVVSDSGEGLSGVSVTASPTGFSTITGLDGSFELGRLRPGKYVLSFSKTGYEHQISDSIVLSIEKIIDVLSDVTLNKQSGTFSGIVNDTAGNPLPGVAVTASDGVNAFSTNTNSSGEYIISGVSIGTYSITFHKEAFKTAVFDTATLSIDNRIILIDMVLHRRAGIITGTVTDMRNNTVNGVIVTTGDYMVVTDSNGTYKLNVGELTTYVLSFTKNNYVTNSSHQITLGNEDTVAIFNIQLHQIYGKVTGRVTDSSGNPISKVQVVAGPGVQTTLTDQNGEYLLDSLVLDELYTVSFYAEGFLQDLKNIQLTANARTLTLDVVLVFAAGKITGTVMDSAGLALSGVGVTTNSGNYTATTSPDGVFQLLNLPLDSYILSFTRHGYRDTLSDTLTLDVLSLNVAVNVKMRKAPNTNRDISGTVLGDVTGVDSIIAILSGDGIEPELPWEHRLSWQQSSRRFTGIVSTPAIGNDWTVEITVFSGGRKTGYALVDFDAGAGSVVIPDFNVDNACPRIDSLLVSAQYVNGKYQYRTDETVTFEVFASDTFGGFIEKYEWKFGDNGDWIQSTDSDTGVVLSSFGNAFTCSVRVFDNDGNEVKKSFDVTSIFVVSFNSNTESHIDSQIVEYGNFIVASAPPERTGYRFVEWIDSDSSWDIGDSVVTRDILLHAQWEPIEYRIIYNLDNGSNHPDNPETYTIETDPFDLLEPSKSGITFDGWYDDAEFNNKIDRIAQSTGDIEIFAFWRPWIVSNDTLVDPDGNRYTMVTIGSQIWTIQNLRTTKFNNGDPIDHVIDDDWRFLTTPAYCYYGNTDHQDSIAKFGALYNWYAVNTGRLAPKGWTVPTDDDWLELERYLIKNSYNWDATTSNNKIGKAMASNGNEWNTNGTNGRVGNDQETNDHSGFTGLPGGRREQGDGKYDFIGSNGYWWSATGIDETTAYNRNLNSHNETLQRFTIFPKGMGHSVRLVRNVD